MRKLNIFIKYFSNYGGAERVCMDFAHFLNKEGVPFEVFCGEVKTAPDDKFKMTELGLARPGRYLKALSFFNRAGQAAKNNEGINFSFEKMPFADIYRSGGGSHKVFMKKSLDGLSGTDRLKKIIKRKLDPINRLSPRLEHDTILHPNLKGIIAVSAMLGHELKAEHGFAEGLLKVVHNGVNKQTYNPARRAELAAYTGSIKYIGFASSNFQLKGLKELVSALPLLPDEFRLKVAGDRNPENYKALAENLGVGDRVEFLGKVSDMPAFYSSISLMCHPTYYDTFANVVTEALAMGIPVAVSRFAGSAELVDGTCGRIINEITPENIAKAVLRCAELGFGDYAGRVNDHEDVFRKYLEIAEEADA
jgi:UDP-glucose:(heptosyl)LPS alpha-1,3-glucosyltransferase